MKRIKSMTTRWRKLRKNVKDMIQIQRMSKLFQVQKKNKVLSLTETQTILAKRKERKIKTEKELNDQVEKLVTVRTLSSMDLESSKTGQPQKNGDNDSIKGLDSGDDRAEGQNGSDSDSEEDFGIAGEN